ncbi:Crp/Fnr family transcriptional regulator [Candidatus Venteria ishoeyi]|uniref:Crp/Fnr family transcriptional regulator n=1 Tax=Candidatus Venteria ishoeyi TaxID=1899563 RepID=UPI0025A5B58D|nr:Crp/Fnr family transcriptional regulator [Candidatus Venteria ishoeyi]MDM8546031.1 Crp/Fnr family transcriptional regulator [Candidatus Venteria ishoeyi]
MDNFTPELDQALRKVYLFNKLTDEQMQQLVPNMKHLNLKSGTYLFRQNQPARYFYVLLTGHVKLLRLSAEGGEKVIEIISRNDTFAEALMFMEKRLYPVDAQALLDSEVLAISNTDFLQLLSESFDTCQRILGDMSLRLHHWLDEIDNLTLQNASYRLVNYLLCQIPTQLEDNQYDIYIDFPKQVLASRLSIKPETLSRILHQLTNKGLITVEKRVIHVLNVQEFRSCWQA